MSLSCRGPERCLSLQSWPHLLRTTAQDGRVAMLSPLPLLPSTSVLIPNPQIPPRGKCIVYFPLSQEYPSNTKVTGLEIPSFSNKPLLFTARLFFSESGKFSYLDPKGVGEECPTLRSTEACFLHFLSFRLWGAGVGYSTDLFQNISCFAAS